MPAKHHAGRKVPAKKTSARKAAATKKPARRAALAGKSRRRNATSPAALFRRALDSDDVKVKPTGRRRLAEVAKAFGSLSPELAELWQVHDRVDVCFDEYEYLPCEHALGEWRSMKQARDEYFAVVQWAEPVDRGVQSLFWHDGWQPFARDGLGGLVCVDTAPSDEGVAGQVIFVGRDPDVRKVLGRSLGEWIADVGVYAIPTP